MNPSDLTDLAALARLSLSEEERTALLPRLNALLALADSLPLPHSSAGADEPSAVQPPRTDEPAPGLLRDALLSAAPARESGYFTVPAVGWEDRHE